jgi:hypothetical protein
MNPLLTLIFKHYNVSHLITKSEKFNKTEYRVRITFEPKKEYYLTPAETSSLAIFDVFSDDSFEFYDMWYTTEDDMPLLRFFHTQNELDRWLEDESKRLLYEEFNNKS